jgi:hypothetical protein
MRKLPKSQLVHAKKLTTSWKMLIILMRYIVFLVTDTEWCALNRSGRSTNSRTRLPSTTSMKAGRSHKPNNVAISKITASGIIMLNKLWMLHSERVNQAYRTSTNQPDCQGLQLCIEIELTAHLDEFLTHAMYRYAKTVIRY